MPSTIHIRRNPKPKKLKSIRLDSLEIKNQGDQLYYRLKCKNQDGIPVLYLSDAGRP